MHFESFVLAYVWLREWSGSDKLWRTERARAAGIGCSRAAVDAGGPESYDIDGSRANDGVAS